MREGVPVLVTPNLETATLVALNQARESKTPHQIHILHNAYRDPLYMVTAVQPGKLRLEEQLVTMALEPGNNLLS